MIKIKNFLKQYNEFSTWGLALLILYLLPFGLRLLDPTAAPVDLGALSLIALAAVAILTFQALTWVCIKIVWPVIGEYFELYFYKTYKCLSNLQKLAVALTIYFLLFFSFLLALASL